MCDSTIASEESKPEVSIYRERVEFIGKNIDRNVSILLWNITFEDAGEWICFGRNPKEKGRNHTTIFTLIVVDECEWSKLVMWVIYVKEGYGLFSFHHMNGFEGEIVFLLICIYI